MLGITLEELNIYGEKRQDKMLVLKLRVLIRQTNKYMARMREVKNFLKNNPITFEQSTH